MSFAGASGWQIPNVAIPTKTQNTELFIILILDRSLTLQRGMMWPDLFFIMMIGKFNSYRLWNDDWVCVRHTRPSG